MLHFMFFVVILFTVRGEEQINKDCKIFFAEVGASCCEMDYRKRPNLKDFEIMKECSYLPINSCEHQTCLAVNYEYGYPDGTINKTKIQEMVQRDITGLNSAVLTAVKEQCINGDLSHYGPESMCESVKWYQCFLIQVIGHCPKWHNKGPCEGMQENADNCIKHFP